jgi:hypothetical protein
MVVGGTSDVLSPYFHALKGVSVELVGCKSWVLQLFLQPFLQLQGGFATAVLCQKGLAPHEMMGCGCGT